MLGGGVSCCQMPCGALAVNAHICTETVMFAKYPALTDPTPHCFSFASQRLASALCYFQLARMPWSCGTHGHRHPWLENTGLPPRLPSLHTTNSHCCLLLLCSATCLHAPGLSAEDLSSFPMVNPYPGTRVYFIPLLHGVSFDEPLQMNEIKGSWACKGQCLWMAELCGSKLSFALWWHGGLLGSPSCLKWTCSR